jgi:hypothetical protein
MRKKFFLLEISLFLGIPITVIGANNTTSLIPFPPAPQVRFQPPKDFKEAINRIKDYYILREILPPGTDFEKVKENLFGQYKSAVEKFIKENFSNKSFKASNLLKSQEKTSNFPFIEKNKEEVLPKDKESVSPTVSQSEEQTPTLSTSFSYKESESSVSQKTERGNNLGKAEEKSSFSFFVVGGVIFLILFGLGTWRLFK